MSTSAAIGMKLADGSVKAIRVNWDGYPGYTGAVLGGWYRTAEQVEALLALGELSEIKATPETCVAYHRDRHESYKAPVKFATVEAYRRNGESRMAAEYLYLYNKGKWSVYGLYNDPEWNELNVIVGDEEKKDAGSLF